MTPDTGVEARQVDERKPRWPRQRHHREEQRSDVLGMEGGGRREARSLHVVYFLSRDGKAEQPHLIRVHRQRHADGVRLRDVKRWLSELRGKAMADAFAWSCKRRYKKGYVWQDLADDDLITPVSDDEYLLMGSLIITHTAGVGVATATAAAATSPIRSSSSSSSYAFSSPAAADAAEFFSPVAGDPKSHHPPDMPPPEDEDRDGDVSPKPPPRVDDDDDEEEQEEEAEEPRRASFDLPPLRSVSPTRTATGLVDTALTFSPRPADAARGRPPPPASTHVSCGTALDATPEVEREGKKHAVTSPSSRCMLPSKSGSYRQCDDASSIGCGRHLFRSLLRCGAGAGQTNDSAIVPVGPRQRGERRSGVDDCRGDGGAGAHQPRGPTEGGGARKRHGGGRGRRRSRAERAGGEQRKMTAPAEGYRPAAEPNCSQCGRPFRPEKLHSHMKSCRALRGKRKGQRKTKEPREASTRDSNSKGNVMGRGSLFVPPMPLAITSI